MTKKKIKISQQDLDAFHEAVKGTKPIKNNKVRIKTPLYTREKTVKNKQLYFDDETFTLSETKTLDPVQSEEFIAYKQPDVSNKILRKLRKGQYNIEAILDLHGLSVNEAKVAVHRFLQECLYENTRVALIIHGKGRHSQVPILKNRINHWLRELHSVLAFCSAAPSHGSRGAIYVLLKRNKEEHEIG